MQIIVLNVLVSKVFRHQIVKDLLGKKICELRINKLALKHGFQLLTKLKPLISIQVDTPLKGLQPNIPRISKNVVLV